MRRSTDRILTTHVGNLPTLDGPPPQTDEELARAVATIVDLQRQTGLDVVNEGEFTKGGDWLSYVEGRFGGFEPRQRPSGERPLLAQGEDRETFSAFYDYLGETGTLFYNPGKQISHARRPIWVCTAPVTYTGRLELEREIALLKSAAGAEEAFLTSTAPGSLEVYRRDEFYRDEEAFVFAIADALRVEYRMIADSGVLLQIDDAWLPALWDRIGVQMGMEAFRKRCGLRIAALNHALDGIPADRVRYHLCWGSWRGPHAFDLEFRHIVDLLLQVNADAYLIEGANVRHEHEWAVWKNVRLPEGKILVPGVVSHATDTIEHPELVSQRIQRFASVVGAHNVIAGTDCGFGGRSHPQIAWAKLAALVEGARLASKALF